LNFCDIVVTILKMATDRNCSMSGINSRHHNVPTYELICGYIMMSRIDSRHWTISTGRHFQNGDIVVTILKMATDRNCSMSGINSRHHNVPTYEMALKSDNIGKNQHCPISSQFDMWVDNDVLNWFLTLKNFYWSPFSKCPPQYRKNSTLSDIITIWYVGDIGQCWIFVVLWWPFWKWRSVEIVQCWESIRDIIIYPHIKFWCQTTNSPIRAFNKKVPFTL
jgi:hypothetical protein